MTKNQSENFAELHYYIEKHQPAIETALREFLPAAPPNIETKFNQAVELILFSGGERTLSILTLLGAELFGGAAKRILPAAAAMEFVWTSSLIFDSLSAADDAAARTLPPEKFGEATTIAIAVALLNAAYGLIFVNHLEQPERAMAAHAELVECVNSAGIFSGKLIETQDFGEVSNLKIAALPRLSLRGGAILAGADYLELAQISRFAELFGEILQLSEELEKDTAASAVSQTPQNAAYQRDLLIADAKMLLIENFPSSTARSCLIQLTEKSGK